MKCKIVFSSQPKCKVMTQVLVQISGHNQSWQLYVPRPFHNMTSNFVVIKNNFLTCNFEVCNSIMLLACKLIMKGEGEII